MDDSLAAWAAPAALEEESGRKKNNNFEENTRNCVFGQISACLGRCH